MRLIPYKIQIRNKTYTGYLGTSDISGPPNRFFVFMDMYIVGELMVLPGLNKVMINVIKYTAGLYLLIINAKRKRTNVEIE